MNCHVKCEVEEPESKGDAQVAGIYEDKLGAY